MKFLVEPNAFHGGGDDCGSYCQGVNICSCNYQTCDCYQAGYCGTFDPCGGHLCSAYSTRSV